MLSPGSHVLVLTNRTQAPGAPQRFQESRSVLVPLCPAESGAAQLWASQTPGQIPSFPLLFCIHQLVTKTEQHLHGFMAVEGFFSS